MEKLLIAPEALPWGVQGHSPSHIGVGWLPHQGVWWERLLEHHAVVLQEHQNHSFECFGVVVTL